MNNDVVMPNAVRTLESRDISEFAELASDNFAPLHMETGRGRDFRGRIRGRQLGDTDVFGSNCAGKISPTQSSTICR